MVFSMPSLPGPKDNDRKRAATKKKKKRERRLTTSFLLLSVLKLLMLSTCGYLTGSDLFGQGEKTYFDLTYLCKERRRPSLRTQQRQPEAQSVLDCICISV